MKEVLLKIIKSILVFPFALAGAILLSPIILLITLIDIPGTALGDIWEDR